jgi:hypothetical protein
MAQQPARYYYTAGLFSVIGIIGVLVVLAVRAAGYLAYAQRAITFPFGLDYGEGIVWQQALLIPGPQMYGDITRFPFIVFHYTPLYHLIVHALLALGADPLAAGRGLSITATVGVAILTGCITIAASREDTSISARLVGAVVAGLMVLTYWAVQRWAVLMRVDMLAIAFSTAGVYLAVVSRKKAHMLYAAVVAFVFAIYTKQTEGAAPIAAVLVTATVDFRLAIRALLFGLLLGGAAFLILQLSTDTRFWHHIVTYNLHEPFLLHQLLDLLLAQKLDAIGVLTGITAFALLWGREATRNPSRDLRVWFTSVRESERLYGLAILSVWFTLASAQLITAGKIGANYNYFIEWMCIMTVPIGMVTSIAWDAATRDKLKRFPSLAVFLSVALIGHALTYPFVRHVFHRPLLWGGVLDDPTAVIPAHQLVDLIQRSAKPALSEDMVLLLRAGQRVPVEPIIFSSLAITGNWDQQLLLKLLHAHNFGLIITAEPDLYFTKEMLEAIQTDYPIIEHFGNYVVRRPLKP